MPAITARTMVIAPTGLPGAGVLAVSVISGLAFVVVVIEELVAGTFPDRDVTQNDIGFNLCHKIIPLLKSEIDATLDAISLKEPVLIS